MKELRLAGGDLETDPPWLGDLDATVSYFDRGDRRSAGETRHVALLVRDGARRIAARDGVGGRAAGHEISSIIRPS